MNTARIVTLAGVSLATAAITLIATQRRSREEEPAMVMDTTAARAVMLTAAQVARGGIRWEPAQTRTVSGSTEVAGKLVADEDRTARIGAPTQGRVLAVYVQLGDRVRPGQRLVALQSPEASAASAEHDRAVAELRARQAAAQFARIARERAERLLAVKAMAQQDVERARAEEEMAGAEVARARADVQRVRAALGQWEVAGNTGTMVLRAPRGGAVLSREATPGAVVDAGMPLVTVSDISSLWLDAAATERDASALSVGAPLRFAVPAFPSDTFSARVRAIGGALDPQARRIIVRATVSNTTGRLRPEMYATVWIESGAQRHAVVIPQSAVQLVDGRTVAFVAMPMGDSVHFQRRDIELGASFGTLVEIKSGIAAGEPVVVTGAFAVKAELSRSKMPAMEM